MKLSILAILCKFVKLLCQTLALPRFVKYENMFADSDRFALWHSEELTALDLHTAEGR